MNKLQCTLCGGKLVMDDDGQGATCESCGMAFRMEAVQRMLTEITGTVSVNGIAELGNLLIRADEFDKLNDFDKAKEYYQRVLDLDPTNEAARKWEASRNTLVIQSYGNNKISVIKTIREITGLGLKEAKDLVESAPVDITNLVSHQPNVVLEIKKMLKEAGAIMG